MRRLLGLSLVVAGGALNAWFVRRMRQAQTTMNPTKSATTLVTDGPFAFSRNPGYLGLATVYTGLALALNSLAALLLLPGVLLVVTRGVIARGGLLRRPVWGAYRRYQTRVRRWL